LAGVKQSGCEVNHSPPPRREVKNKWSYTSAPPTRLHGEDKDNFTFTPFLFSSTVSGSTAASCTAEVPLREIFDTDRFSHTYFNTARVVRFCNELFLQNKEKRTV
jgi:hypothetical protein